VVEESTSRGTLRYVVGDATAPQGSGPAVIAHVCNDVGAWGAGFVLALSRRWRAPEAEYRRWYAERDGNDFAIGAVQLVPVEPDVWVANMVGQTDLRRARDGTPPVRYAAIETALQDVAARARELGASVHMPRIGCGLAGGDWARIEPLLESTLVAAGVDVVVYDLP
jgi:O-acetyl-ADP-ribose deacetylase (regulator of RNase III)